IDSRKSEGNSDLIALTLVSFRQSLSHRSVKCDYVDACGLTQLNGVAYIANRVFPMPETQ
ncbi:unnamed protein product, partial [Calicophoron daubneyi]